MLYLIWFLVYSLIVGVIVSFIAKLLHEPLQGASWLTTFVIGVVGSLIGGGITWLTFGGTFGPAGITMSVVGGVIFCWLYGKYHLANYIPLDTENHDE